MNAIETANWEDFDSQIKEIRRRHGPELLPLLFRGQGDSEWELSTTLDRNTDWVAILDSLPGSSKYGMRFSRYYDLITKVIAPEVQTFSGPIVRPTGAAPSGQSKLL